MKKVSSWSGLCHQAQRCNARHDITQYWFFRFNFIETPCEDDESTENRSAVCNVIRTVDDIWRSLEEDSGPGVTRFFKFAPSPQNAPPECLKEPSDVAKVTERLENERDMIAREAKLNAP